jgi:ComF family protein
VLRTLTRGLVLLLSPPTCAACGLPREDGYPKPGLYDQAERLGAQGGEHEAFCDACAPLLEPLPGSDAENLDDSAYVYAGPLADAIRSLKYGRRFELGRALGRLLAARTRGRLEGLVDVVTPMPLHPRKLRARGVNPSLLLAREVARELGVPLSTRLVARRRDTREQAGLARKERGENVLGAFSARPVHAQRMRVLLVDDVRTTGATLHEAARALMATGHEVRTLTLALAPATE